MKQIMRISIGIAATLAVALLAPAAALTAGGGPLDTARRLFEATEFTRAIALLESTQPNPASLELLGQCYYLAGEFKKATEMLERAAALKPDDSFVQTWLARAYGRRAETSSPLGALHFANRTRESFEKAVELDPSNSEALNDLFDFYVRAPGLVGGGIDRAKALLPRISRLDPVGYQLAEAELAEHDKHFGEAEAYLQHAISMAPGKPALYMDLAKFLARRGRHEESESAFTRAYAIAPKSHRIDYERAETYLQFRRNPEQARQLLHRYLASTDLTPNDPPRTEAMRLLKKAEGTNF